MNRLKKITKYGFLAGAVLAVVVGCRDFSFSAFMRGEPVASVGEQRLYAGDIPLQFNGLTPADSLKLLRSYVEGWVRQQLIIRQAEQASTSEAEARVEAMVEEYRRSLLIYEYEKAYIDARLDTVITAEEIREYYETNADDFRLATPLIKGVAVRFPAGFRQESQLRQMAVGGQPERVDDLIDIAVKNNFAFREFNDWSEPAQVTAFLPRMSEAENERMLRAAPSFFETEQGGNRYFVVVTGLLPAASPMPPERAEGTIRTLIVTRRRQQLLRALEEELLRQAAALEEVKINVDTTTVR